MARTALPHDAKAGPTKPEVRSVTLGKLELDDGDHFVEVGSCTGAVTIEAARRAGRVTALERIAGLLDSADVDAPGGDISETSSGGYWFGLDDGAAPAFGEWVYSGTDGETRDPALFAPGRRRKLRRSIEEAEGY